MKEPMKDLPVVPNMISPSKICIFMVATPEIHNYARYSIKINKEYCDYHGYHFKVFEKNLTPDLPINFSKIQAALELMKLDYDYIMHIDADAIIHYKEYPITNILARYPQSFLVSEDCYADKACGRPGRINSGVFIVKKGTIGKRIMKSWLNNSRSGRCKKYVNQFPSCQLVFDNCVRWYWWFGIRILPYNVLNGRNGLLITHVMADTTENRIDEFKKHDMINDERWKNGESRMRVFS